MKRLRSCAAPAPRVGAPKPRTAIRSREGRVPSRSLTSLVALLALTPACGATPLAVTAPPPSSESPSETAPSTTPGETGGDGADTPSDTALVLAPSAAAPQDAPTWAELRDSLEPVVPAAARTPRTALDDCPAPASTSEDALIDFYEGCVIRPMAIRERDAWLVLRTNSSEGGIEQVFLHRARPGAADEVVVTGALEPELLRRVRTTLSRARSSVPSIVTGSASVEFSLSAYPVLVALGAPLEGSLLFLETTLDLDHPEHVLRLVRRDGTELELARQPARLTPCDGDGWSCHDGNDDDCAPEELRAEQRLCVEPRSIDSVHVSGRELLVIGTVIVAGDGGYPSFDWAVQLPE